MSKPLNDWRFQEFGAIAVLPSKTIPQKKGCQGFCRSTFLCQYGAFFFVGGSLLTVLHKRSQVLMKMFPCCVVSGHVCCVL